MQMNRYTKYHIFVLRRTEDVTYAQHTMRRLGVIRLSIQWFCCILIACIFYGMLQNHLSREIAKQMAIFPFEKID